MPSCQVILPKVTSFLICISLRVGSLIIPFICVMFSGFHSAYLWYLKKKFLKDKEHTSSGKMMGLAGAMAVSHVIFTLYNICLIIGALKEDCPKVKCWLIGAMQNAFVMFFTELLAGPFFFSKKTVAKPDALAGLIHSDVLAQWPFTILFSIWPLIEFYFMIVVNSYYLKCKSEEAFHPKPCRDCNLHN